MLLTLWPSLTLVVGVAVGGAASGVGVVPKSGMLFVVSLAALAPVIAVVVLGVVAPGFDRTLVAVAGVLIAIGTATLYGLSLLPDSDGAFYATIATRHALFVSGGYLALAVGAISEREVDRTRRYPYTILIMAIGLTAATAMFGETVNGARLWLDMGPVRFQPAEISRLLIVVFVAVFLHERRHLLAAPWRVRTLDLPPAPYLLPLVGAVAIAAGVLVFQNDLGMAALVVLGAGAVVVGVVRTRAAIGIAALILCGALVGAFLVVPRVRDRVQGWLDPWSDPAGRGFQFVQADYTLSAGQLVGEGDAHSVASVPEVHTDMILVAVGGLFGLLLTLAVLTLAAVLVCRCLLAGLQTRDGFRALVALSLSALIAIQVILIAGGSLRVLPLTGLTFPLVSYGGTSTIVSLFALGIVVGIGANPRPARGTKWHGGSDGAGSDSASADRHLPESAFAMTPKFGRPELAAGGRTEESRT